jgi:hypothetical protein
MRDSFSVSPPPSFASAATASTCISPSTFAEEAKVEGMGAFVEGEASDPRGGDAERKTCISASVPSAFCSAYHTHACVRGLSLFSKQNTFVQGQIAQVCIRLHTQHTLSLPLSICLSSVFYCQCYIGCLSPFLPLYLPPWLPPGRWAQPYDARLP